MEEFYVGQKASISKVFTQEEVNMFSKLSLDTNPVHLDESYAATTRFQRRIIHGYLGASLISAVIGTLLPGKGAIYLHQDLDFRKPLFVGETITATVTLVNIRKEKNILFLDTVCTNDKDEIVIEGKAVVKYLCDNV